MPHNPRTSYLHDYQPTLATICAAKEAVEIQDAVNMRAIIATMLHRIDAMRAEVTSEYPHGITGDLLQNHPVVIAYIDKLCSLSRIQSFSTGEHGMRISHAHMACTKLAAGEVAVFEVHPL